MFVYLGNDPLPTNTSIDPEELDDNLKIKARPKSLAHFGDFLLGSFGGNVSKGSRRTKERKIGDVIKKVSEWRRLYNGIDENG